MSGQLMGDVWMIDLSAPEQTIMLALADHGSSIPGQWGYGYDIFPSVTLLAWKTGKTERQVQRILRTLTSKRLIVAVGFSGGGRGHATRYEMHLENGRVKLPPERVKGDIQGQDNENGLKGDIQGLKGDIQGLKGDIQGLKGDIAMSPEPLLTINNQEEPNAHTRVKKKRMAEPEPEPEPDTPPDSAPPPPSDGPPVDVRAWEAEYRRQHGALMRYSQMYRAFYEAFGMTPAEARTRAGKG